MLGVVYGCWCFRSWLVMVLGSPVNSVGKLLYSSFVCLRFDLI